jgi:hypothetical protein
MRGQVRSVRLTTAMSTASAGRCSEVATIGTSTTMLSFDSYAPVLCTRGHAMAPGAMRCAS